MKNPRETLLSALQRQRRQMPKEGKLDFTGIEVNDLKQLGSQKALKHLILDKTPLNSLHTLPPQPSLISISANNSKINTLAGLSNQKRLSSLSIIGTPISQVENFRLAVMLAVGPRISIINGQRITKTERRMVKSYPPIAKYLVNAGWVVTYPPPSELDFHYLAEQFDIKANNDDFIAPVPAIASKALPEEEKIPTEDKDIPFTEQLASILRPLGFAVRCGPEIHGDIIRAISRMCETVEKVEQMGKM
ncbi:hypothetical protein TRFO_24350 [Tritrichomonas foetus]|uniref:Uncharacterized protein n=1 Tax=Tritrichomonas foetus TaxID=1144522 RepID=A0A1J4K8B6_9EUKA|nr:hypothetical protein TRFO_24350 [Tritrichomonas foetus]|eukprot:OHT07451.1 hypothetical protein TRFO_24350 [Tritrichomonas foetus]